MIKKISIMMAAFIFAVSIQLMTSTCKVHAQGNTKIMLTTDKTQYNVGDTVKVTIKAQNVIDLYGLQFTIHYDSSLLEMQGGDVTFEKGYTVFGGKTVDKSKGIITYPVINQNASTEKKENENIGYVSFKAVKKGPVIMTMDNIKAVNSKTIEINYNTQTQAVYNIVEKAAAVAVPSNNTNTQAGNDKKVLQDVKKAQAENNPSVSNSTTAATTTQQNAAMSNESKGVEADKTALSENKDIKSISSEAKSSNKNQLIMLASVLGLLIISSLIYAVKNKETLTNELKTFKEKIKNRKLRT